MKTLSVESINRTAPYPVENMEGTNLYVFTSDSGVELAVDFLDDEIITSSESYQLIVSNVNNSHILLAIKRCS